MVIFGIPTIVISIVCYALCCMEPFDESEMGTDEFDEGEQDELLQGEQGELRVKVGPRVKLTDLCFVGGITCPFK